MVGYADVLESLTPRLYAIFSHVYHTKYSFCVTEVYCEEQSKMPFPCNVNSSSFYYKYTALIGRYTYWVNIILEDFNRVTTDPPTCRPLPGKKLHIPKEEYDDEYNNNHGPMVSNHKVCQKVNWSSAATIHTVADTIIATVISIIVILTTTN